MEAEVARVAHHKWPGATAKEADEFMRDIGRAEKNDIAFPADLLRDIRASDVIVIPQTAANAWYCYIRLWQGMGKVVVMDVDDDSFNVHPLSPSYAIRGTELCEVKSNGETILRWEDVRDHMDADHEELAKRTPPVFVMYLERNRKLMGMAEKALRECDAITTTTERARQRFLDFNPNVFVLPNSLDTDLYLPGRHPGRKGFRVGWFGGNSHEGDLLAAVRGLARFIAETPDATLVVSGTMTGTMRRLIPADRLEFWEWSCVEAHPWRLQAMGYDLGFAAVEAGTKFNACKSALKWTEFGALGVPTICTDAPPYSDAVRHGEDGWLVKNEPDAWYAAFRRMYEEPELRRVVGENARARMVRDFDLYRNAGLWYSCYKSLIEARKTVVVPQGVR